MVDKGQLLERPVIIPHQGLCLDGIFLRGTRTPPLLIASPHPLLGGSMQNAIVNELAYAAARSGHASLRFDYEGVGASEGTLSDDPERATGDMAAALEHLAETTRASSFALAGYSYGCLPSLRLAARESRVDRLLLVAPPRKVLELPDYASVSVPIAIVAGERDDLVSIEKERVLAEAVALVSPRVSLHVVRDGDHALRSGLVELCRVAERFLGASKDARIDQASGPL
jgi:alpha/beta superfamily hydrolase